jgi:hypothetical protein
MFYSTVVKKALKRCLAKDSKSGRSVKDDYRQNNLIPLVIHDIFGGEILKTSNEKGWHYYNRIDGERLDFTEPDNSYRENQFEDLLSSPDEIVNFFPTEDYITFFMRFIKSFEEAVGLKKFRFDAA